MLDLYVLRAGIVNGMDILELGLVYRDSLLMCRGCGWGSLTLFLAQKFPKCSITAVSNSKTQKEFIDERYFMLMNGPS